MELNLQILQTDLADIVTGAHIFNDILERNLSYPVLYSGETCPFSECLYLVKAEDLPSLSGIDLRHSPSLLPGSHRYTWPLGRP